MADQHAETRAAWWHRILGRKAPSVVSPWSGPREWCEVTKWGGRDPGEIPRDVLEGWGINCSPLDRRDTKGRQGTVWFTAEQGEKIRRHPDFRPLVIDGDDAS